ncbi:MAG: hypothetical protein H6Q00_2238 [Holophagaceae bacterium]|nr:hypothetical protein [Holophagaceae bacterium]
MDAMPPKPAFALQALIDAAQQALPRALQLELTLVTGPDQETPSLQVAWPEGRTTLKIMTQAIRRTEDLGMLRARTQNLPERILAAPYLTAHLARACMELGIQFIDMAGNIHITVPGLTLGLIGNKLTDAAPIERPKPFKGFNRKGLQVIFGLLAGEDRLGTTYRALAEELGVARGTVGEVLTALQGAGFLLTKDGKRILLQEARLREGWLANYPYKLRPHLNPTRYRATQPDWWKQTALDPKEAQWGGEVAADRLTGNLQPGMATLYTVLPHEKLAAHLRLRPDPQGEVEILDRFWAFPNQADYPADLAPALLVYADLVASADPRNADIARMIHDAHLRP